MKKFGRIFADSLNEFKNVRSIAVCGLLAAISIVLGSLTIVLGDYVKIGFSGIPNQIAGALFGPAISGIFGGVLDILKFIVKPTGAFFPGFTFNAILAGVIYGLFYYKKKVTLKRVLLAQLVVILIVNIGLNTYWISVLYGKSFMVLLPLRAIKNFIMWPIDSVICFSLMKSLDVAVKPFLIRTLTKKQSNEQIINR